MSAIPEWAMAKAREIVADVTLCGPDNAVKVVAAHLVMVHAQGAVMATQQAMAKVDDVFRKPLEASHG